MRNASIVVAALLLLASCGDLAVTPPNAVPEKPSLNQVDYVTLCCNATLYAGGTTQYAVTVYPFSGSPYSTQFALWGSSNPSVASVGSFGVVQANSPGYAAISATVEGKSATVVVQVVAAPVVTTVQVTPSSATLNVGTTQSLTAKAYSQYGTQMSGQTATWSTGNSGVATVSPTGVVTGVAPGTTTITATIAGKTASVSVTVANAIVLGDIYGPDMILAGGTYTWGVTSVSGGNGTYTYEWQIDWFDTPFEGYVPLATGPTLSRNVTGCDGNFRIGLLVVSGNASTWTNYEVENFASEDMCP